MENIYFVPEEWYALTQEELGSTPLHRLRAIFNSTKEL